MIHGACHWWRQIAFVSCLILVWFSMSMLSRLRYTALDGLVPPDARNVTYEYNTIAKGSVRYEPSSEHAGLDDTLARIGWQHTWQTEDALLASVTIPTQEHDRPLEALTILSRQHFGFLTDFIEICEFYGPHPSVAIYVQHCLHVHRWQWCG